MDEWEHLSEPWRKVVADDPVFSTDVLPLLLHHVPGRAGTWLDLGCGDGRVMSHLPDAVGCDISFDLLRTARRSGPVVRCRLPDLSWLRTDGVDGAYAVLVLEHIGDLRRLLTETARVVRPGGSLVVVANHPAFTPEGAGPIVDLTDGEVLWRWGPYFDERTSRVPIGDRVATVHHRTLGTILTAAATAGWKLTSLEECPLGEAAVAALPGYAGQSGLPRLMACHWVG